MAQFKVTTGGGASFSGFKTLGQALVYVKNNIPFGSVCIYNFAFGLGDDDWMMKRPSATPHDVGAPLWKGNQEYDDWRATGQPKRKGVV